MLKPLPGLEAYPSFVIESAPGYEPFLFMVASDDPTVTLTLVDPFLISVDEAELLSRLLADQNPAKSLETVVESPCRTWLGQLSVDFAASEIPRLVGVAEAMPTFRSNLRTQIGLPLLVEGEPFFEVKAILAPSL